LSNTKLSDCAMVTIILIEEVGKPALHSLVL
jgi:hypothetical protein